MKLNGEIYAQYTTQSRSQALHEWSRGTQILDGNKKCSCTCLFVLINSNLFLKIMYYIDCLRLKFMCNCNVFIVTVMFLFRVGFFGRPWTEGGGGGRQTAPLRLLKTIKDIDMKVTPLIKRRKINLLLLSYLSCDVT